MPLRRAYAPVMPELDSFLYASVGEEADGFPLSVLSALTRLGLDPRDEGARLAHLTKDEATDQLARIIGRLSDRGWSAAEMRRIARDLAELLPAATSAGSAERETAPRLPLLLLCILIAGAALVGFFAR